MLKHNIKAVFFDIDGTLTSFKTHLPSASTEEAIAQLKAQNIKVIISTGRSIQHIAHLDYLKFDGFITFNGGYCLSNQAELLFKKTIDHQDIQSLISYANEQAISFSLMMENEVGIYGLTPEIASMYAHLNLPVPPLLKLDNIAIHQVLQTNIFMDTDAEKSFMAKVMPNSLATRWSPLFADVNPKGQSKRIGVDVFCRYFNISPISCMAFGDGGNDLEMLKHVGTGIAMGNANPILKENADYITDTVDKDGIWKALKYFNLI